MKKFIIPFILLLLSGLPLLAQINQIEFVEYDLENGLHVILHEDHSTPIVAVSVLYHAACTPPPRGPAKDRKVGDTSPQSRQQHQSGKDT